jgi:Fur family peroxide stress response transcriptional regulator
MDGRIRQLAERVHQRGGRMTPQRMAILRVLANNANHPTIEEIYRQVQEVAPTTSLATVYKTVALLKEMGEVQEVSSLGDETRVDGFRPHPHPHLICIRCGRIVDVAVDDLPEMLSHIAGEASGWQVQERLDFWGLCPVCRENEPF